MLKHDIQLLVCRAQALHNLHDTMEPHLQYFVLRDIHHILNCIEETILEENNDLRIVRTFRD